MIGSDDSVVAFNFRPDRMRQLSRALAEPGFGEGAEALPGWGGRDGAPTVARYTTLTEYQEGWPYPVAFAPARPVTTLGLTLARAGATQLHVAETEKYPHVTYFFNGGEEAPLVGEERELVPSPRDVPTYDHKPQMSAAAAADAFVAAWREERGAQSASPCEFVTCWKMENASLVFSSTRAGAPAFAVGKMRCSPACMK